MRSRLSALSALISLQEPLTLPAHTMKHLHALITPALLGQLADARIPWKPTDTISGNGLMNGFFGDESRFHSRANIAWPALKCIAESYGPDTVPDLRSFLPHPNDPAFPRQAFGMHVLLDQAPRSLFQGIDGRWTSWFDKLVHRLYQFFWTLSAKQRPWARERWAGMSFEYWFAVSWEFNASMAHRENIVDQEKCLARCEELRCAVEEFTGRRDIGRDDGDGWKTDVFAFPEIISHLDLERHWAFHDAAFFVLRVDEVHKPIIDRFGRYPYRNAIEGRESTIEEKKWIKKTNHFAEAPPEVAKRVMEDVEAGIWTPLQGGEVEDTEALVRFEATSETSLNITIRTSNQAS